MAIEVELKVRVPDRPSVVGWLAAQAAGEPSTYRDTYYDWPDGSLEREGRKGAAGPDRRPRGRVSGRRSTSKAPMLDSTSTPEYETSVTDATRASTRSSAASVSPTPSPTRITASTTGSRSLEGSRDHRHRGRRPRPTRRHLPRSRSARRRRRRHQRCARRAAVERQRAPATTTGRTSSTSTWSDAGGRERGPAVGARHPPDDAAPPAGDYDHRQADNQGPGAAGIRVFAARQVVERSGEHNPRDTIWGMPPRPCGTCRRTTAGWLSPRQSRRPAVSWWPSRPSRTETGQGRRRGA